ncbi:putative multiple-sugar transport system permease YteP [Paenibacillus tyrfis]|uniref:ABC transporter permease n=1 Tax=Paenibacillus TaxID=44249 RepID=UPI000248C2DF|nr:MULTISPECIES: ABC transporter permease subunit [Paenibacillus]GLI04608.1 putative multiple-sugar transport system permease YteP [Paenibacillus tyrfis]GMX65415.1 polygalacturonan/rhamnogalacturonan ABC transporter permease [Paenibacillus elgii]
MLKDLVRDKYLYLLLLPGMLFIVVFKYIPMYGLVIAFQEYNILQGVGGSDWVGLYQFEKLFTMLDFTSVFKNTLIISTLKLVWGFPAPIVLALLLNEVKQLVFQRFVQTVVYLPHFISWVIFSGIIIIFLNPVDGLVNQVMGWFGGEPVDFLIEKSYFRSILVATDIYKEVGWGTIIYLAAISGINPQLYEAAIVDGAGRFRQMWNITLPSIRHVIVILFILSLGNILDAGFLQTLLLYNPLVMDVADIIDTYVYRKGIVDASYSLGAAAGVFKSVIALILVAASNQLAKRFGEEGLW